mgnify:CR=1 FL=1
MMNVPQTQAQLAKLPDAQLQQFAAAHKADPYMLSLAMAEFNRRKETRSAAQGQAGAQQAPKVVDQAVAGMAPESLGIGRLPAPGVANMASGGIVAFAGGGGMEQQIPMSGYPPAPPSADAARLQELEDMYIPQGATSLWEEREALRQRKRQKPVLPGGPDTGDETSRLLKRRPAPVPAAAPVSAPTAAEVPDTTTSGILALSRQGGGRPYVPDTFEQAAEATRKGAAPARAETAAEFAPYHEMLKKEREELSGRKEGNVKDALVRAGLGMLSGTSPHAMVNIGKGGVEGLDAYQKAKAADDAAMKANTSAQMLAMQADRAARAGDTAQATALYGQVQQQKGIAAQIAVQRDHFKLQALMANKTPAEIQMVERVAKEKKIPFSEALQFIYGAKFAPKGESALQTALAKDPFLKDTNPVLYAQLLEQSGLGAGGGAGMSPEDAALVKKYGK